MLHSPRARRRSPLFILLAGTFIVALLYCFLHSSSDSKSPQRLKQIQQAAAHALSPASLPFRKTPNNYANSKEVQSSPPVVHYYMNNLTTTTDPIANKESVLILTPLARFYQEYWDNLEKLSYPHELISLGFIIPKGREGNLATSALEAQLRKTQNNPKKAFKSVTILRQDSEPPLSSQTEAERHKMENQKARRASMAAARNSLLFSVLGPMTSWVLWLDSDIVESPPTLIQDLASKDKPIIVANCMQRWHNKQSGKNEVRPYDYNNWIDSDTARDLGKKMGRDEILLEGYAEMATYRTLMAKLADVSADGLSKERVIELDGVGGTALLVKAEVHRAGAMFPPFAFYHVIESEGFAKMARRLGWKSWGLPDYFVYHYNE